MRTGLKNVHVINRLHFLTAMFKSRDHDPSQSVRLVCKFKYPDQEVPLGSAPFERLADDTCLQSGAAPWTALQWLVDHQSNYTRPEAGDGVEVRGEKRRRGEEGMRERVIRANEEERRGEESKG